MQASVHFDHLGGDIVSVTVCVFWRSMAIGASDGSGGAGDNAHFVWRDAPSGKLLYDRMACALLVREINAYTYTSCVCALRIVVIRAYESWRSRH